jgi:hypothetical protein
MFNLVLVFSSENCQWILTFFSARSLINRSTRFSSCPMVGMRRSSRCQDKTENSISIMFSQQVDIGM